MRFEKIELMGGAWLDAYIADPVRDFTRRALVVIPGGGYGGICSEREGEPIAMAFLPYGYNAFVLHYTVGRKAPFPCQEIEAASAIAYIKTHANELGVKADEVFTVGFSAGGHLAASTGVFWKLDAVTRAGISPALARPAGVMLIYPVISPEHHAISFQNLLCTDTPTREQSEAVAIERHVDADSSPAFLMHTSNDGVVDVKNSLVLASAYRDAGVEFEMHIYPDAPHGAALGNAITRCQNAKWEDVAIASWVSAAAYWADGVCKKQKIK